MKDEPLLLVHAAGAVDLDDSRRVASSDGTLVASREQANRIIRIGEGLLRQPGVTFAHRTRGPDEADDLKTLLCRLHDPDYLAALQHGEAEGNGGQDIGPYARRFSAEGVLPDTPIDDYAFTRASDAAHAALEAARSIAAGETRYAYALGRPPGHHAGRAFLGGYCFLNNAAVAALALERAGLGPVHVLDIDYHVGSGTSDVLVRHPSIVFTSLHAATDRAFPYVPALEPAYSSHRYLAFASPPEEGAYLDALDLVLRQMQKARILVVSIGFDIVAGDPHGGWTLPPSIFRGVGQRLAATGLPVCFVQEGGYLASALADCASFLMSGLFAPASVQRKVVS